RASQIAKEYRHAFVTPKHLLSALLEPNGAIGPHIEALGLKPNAVLERVRTSITPDEAPPLQSGCVPVASPACRSILRQALNSAAAGQSEQTSASDVFAAILEHGEPSLRQVLAKVGITLDKWKQAAVQQDALRESFGPRAPSPADSLLAAYGHDLNAAAL